MTMIVAGIVVGLCSLIAPRVDASIALYDGAQPGLPQSQGWLAYESLPGTASTTLAGGSVGPTILDTTAGGSNSIYAGFSDYNASGSLYNSAFPTLSPTTGFDLTFDLKLDSESHSSADRAGFSVILTGSDLYGVELGFWNGQIFAQSSSPLFTHSVEQTTGFDPASGFHAYDLHIQGTTYTLSADGSQILTGPTRSYATSQLPPYTTPDFLFLGDDTTSAQGIAEIQSIAVSVPEPTSVAMLIALPLTLGRRRRTTR